MSKNTFGADIEVFFTREGKTESSQVLFPNHERIEVAEGVVERDGYAAELQPAPSENTEKVIDNVRVLLKELWKIMKRKKLEFDHRHVVNVDLAKLHKMKDQDSLIFGCKPDMNAYSKNFNDKPNAETVNQRTAGGHIHVGLGIPMEPIPFAGYMFYRPVEEKDEEYLLNVLSWMDMLIGLPAVLFDTPTDRRKIYGQAGDFRFTKPNIEYRSLSNFMLMSPDLMTWTLEQTKHVLRVADSYKVSDLYDPAFIQSVKNSINHCNVEQAVTCWNQILEVLQDTGINLEKDLPTFNDRFEGWL